ncbi:hypothetical protein FOL47_010506 [Perkinsus chesapeaki]|uniref:Uncharacterized protein n=1 Tax=Perkinsus chesapeaki TaxID=330153 RepID=A0A7J6MPL2_PERCH|nr:hypothetical protein FOL47_010506 [Perkinsus chesapeaki]
MHSLSAAALLVLSRQLLATSPLGVGFIEGSIRIVGMGISIREHQDDDSQCIVIDYTSKQALGLHKDSSHPLSVKSAVCMELVGTTPQQKSLPRGFELSGAEEGALKGVYVRRLYAEDPTVNKTGSNLQDGEQWTLFDRKHVEVQALDAQKHAKRRRWERALHIVVDMPLDINNEPDQNYMESSRAFEAETPAGGSTEAVAKYTKKQRQ